MRTPFFDLAQVAIVFVGEIEVEFAIGIVNLIYRAHPLGSIMVYRADRLFALCITLNGAGVFAP